nr:protein kinase [uncultured Undibacterium sp.]
MPLHPNSQLLVDTLESLPLLDNRFEKIKLVNYDSVTNDKRGCFSLVFRAFDRLSQKNVALKFYDLHPTLLTDKYRRESFEREHQILESLLTVDRCLQLVSKMNAYSLLVPLPSGVPFEVQCHYFAVEWIDQEIDDFFLCQHQKNAIDKLRIFNEILLAVEVLHNHEIFHRDLKADNLRAYTDAMRRIVVAIDLGTAAKFESGKIQSTYAQQVGAPAYAAPEAIGGLMANRNVASFTDMYALGCLLFELFNMDYFYYAVRRKNPNYDHIIWAISSTLAGHNDVAREKEWLIGVNRMSAGITPLSIAEPGNSVPQGIAGLLTEILQSLTNFNYQNRPKSLKRIRSKVWSAIVALTNERDYQRRLKKTKENRLLRERKIAAKEARLALIGKR